MGPWLAISIGLTAMGSPAPTGAELILAVRVDNEPPGAQVEEFLMQRAIEAWQLATLDEVDRYGDTLPLFKALVEFLSGEQMVVTVAMGAEVLTRRTIEIRDPLEAKVTAWLLLKSTIDRGLKQARGPKTPESPSDGAGASGKPAPGETAPADLSSGAAPGSGSPGTVPPLRPGHRGPGAAGFVAAVWLLRLDAPNLFSTGLSGGVGLRWAYLALAVNGGYRFTPGPEGLEIHSFPLTGSISVEGGNWVRAGFGLNGTAELKLPVSERQSRAVVGVELGPFGQARVPLTDETAFLLRFAIGWQVVRQRYLYVYQGSPQEVVEHLWIATLGAGLDWH